jgi:hypothetical protein
MNIKSPLQYNTFRYGDGSEEFILSPSDGNTIHVLLYKFPTPLINPLMFKLIWLYYSVHCYPITEKYSFIGRLAGSDYLLLIRTQFRGRPIWSNG